MSAVGISLGSLDGSLHGQLHFTERWSANCTGLVGKSPCLFSGSEGMGGSEVAPWIELVKLDAECPSVVGSIRFVYL